MGHTLESVLTPVWWVGRIQQNLWSPMGLGGKALFGSILGQAGIRVSIMWSILPLLW